MHGPSRLAKQLEGWQVGAIVVFIVSVVTALLVPRTAIPIEVPPPQVSMDDVRQTRAKNDNLVRGATTVELSSAVQLVGARLRALGRAEWEGDDKGVEAHGRSLGQAAAVSFLEGDSLAMLRAYQARVFADAYLLFLRTGVVSDDLVELGGGSLVELRVNGWLQRASEAPPHVDLVLSAFFKRRFSRWVAPDHPALAPNPIEERLLLGYLLQHPPPRRGVGPTNEYAPGEFMLRRIDEIAALEPSYPTLFAKGVVLFQMGQFERASVAFDDYVRTTHDGPYRLRAINHLKASIEHTQDAAP